MFDTVKFSSYSPATVSRKVSVGINDVGNTLPRAFDTSSTIVDVDGLPGDRRAPRRALCVCSR